MDTNTNSSTETVHHVFHAPEIWILLQSLGAVAPGLELPPELASDPGVVERARAALLVQGALVPDAEGRLSLDADIESLVWPVAYPDVVFVANIAHNPQAGQPAREMCFSWTPQALVLNWVDEASRDHHFESLGAEEAQDSIWDHLSHQCDLDLDDRDPEQADPTASEMEQAAGQMRQMVVLVAINRTQSIEQTTHALGWFVSGRHAWLMQKNGQGGELAPGLADQADIAQAVFEFVERALFEGRQLAG